MSERQIGSHYLTGEIKTLASVAEHTVRALAQHATHDIDLLKLFGHYCSEFRHHVKRSGVNQETIAERPSSTGDEVIDTYLAGLAEHLAVLHGLTSPQWCLDNRYVLPKQVVVGIGPRSKALALLETPYQFRKRNLFCGRVSDEFMFTN